MGSWIRNNFEYEPRLLGGEFLLPTSLRYRPPA
jgi:hypothetical protein